MSSEKFNPKDHIIIISKWDDRLKKVVNQNYLEAKWRLVWFREDHPDWVINTTISLIKNGDGPFASLAEAVIKDNQNVVKANGWGYEERIEEKYDPELKKTKTVFNSKFVEKSETTAIARALAQLGYGTQWAMEYEEGQVVEEISDSPVPETVEMEESKEESGNPPTEKQINLIHSLVKGLGMNDEEYRNLLRTDFKVDSSKDLRGKQVQELIDFLKEQSRILKEQK